MSNYPPGMSHRDFVRAGIVEPHSHECEFRPDEARSPFIEDGAAIFHEECMYAEGEYGQGWQCDRTRSYRFEYDVLEVLGGGEIALPTIDDWDVVNDKLSEVVIEIERAYRDDDPLVEANIHPDKDSGEVAISYLGYTLCYRPQ